MRVSGHHSRTSHYNNVRPTHEKKRGVHTHTERKMKLQQQRLAEANQRRIEKRGHQEFEMNQAQAFANAEFQMRPLPGRVIVLRNPEIFAIGITPFVLFASIIALSHVPGGPLACLRGPFFSLILEELSHKGVA